MPAEEKPGPYRQITSLRTILVAGGVFVIGGFLLYLAGLDISFWPAHDGLHALCENTGALLMISVALGALWELVGKRSFAREILEANRIGQDIERAGIRSVGTDYLNEPGWTELFRNVRNLDLFVAYGQTWRNTHLQKLRTMAAKASNRITVFLPDPEDDLSIDMLARRFTISPDSLRGRIMDTAADFAALRVAGGAAVEIRYWPGDRTYSCYRFDDTVVVKLYKHQSRRPSDIPTVVCRAPGSWYDFFERELVDIRVHSRSAD